MTRRCTAICKPNPNPNLNPDKFKPSVLEYDLKSIKCKHLLLSYVDIEPIICDTINIDEINKRTLVRDGRVLWACPKSLKRPLNLWTIDIPKSSA